MAMHAPRRAKHTGIMWSPNLQAHRGMPDQLKTTPIKRPSRARLGDARREGAYHHGNLREALIEAAEVELAARGIEAFSLRGAAKRAGVSHGAPAHHFRDVTELLTALAVLGFERLAMAQAKRIAAAGTEPRSRLVASGMGYLDFAAQHQELFRLMFMSERVNHNSPELQTAGRASYEQLAECVRSATGRRGKQTLAAMVDVTAAWGLAHGLANLLLDSKMKLPPSLTDPRRERFLAAVLSKIG
jgi:AcrR family transcriptional regulator